MVIFRFAFDSRQRVGVWLLATCVGLASMARGQESTDLAKTLGISFPTDSSSTVILEQGGKRYSIDVAAKSVHELSGTGGGGASQGGASSGANGEAAKVFAQNCAACHGRDGAGLKPIGTPNFHDPSFHSSRTDASLNATIHNGKGGIMPAWSGKLTDAQISSLVSYVRSFGGATGSGGAAQASSSALAGKAPSPGAVAPSNSNIYEPGDDLVFSLPTGRPKPKHGLWVNFTHRFAYDPAFTGADRGGILFGLDGFALPSFGLTYAVTDKFYVSGFRSPSAIGRPIQMLAGYQLLDEHHEAPFNLAVRFSVEGQDNFTKNYTQNLEGLFSRSITRRAQIYFAPTASFNDRPVLQGGTRSRDIPEVPGTNAFSLGVGLAVDVRPTVALLAEVIPTVANARELGIHRPAYSFAIQKKIYRHAFTLGFTTSPGTTVSQRAGTRATFIGDPGADKPGGLTIGFDLMRQVH